MEQKNSAEGVSFLGRLGMAFRLLFDPELARRYQAGARALEQTQAAPPPERVHASALLLLSGLQREGRLLDFLQQDVAAFSDEEVGAAARVVHVGCRKLLEQYFEFEPATKQSEGASMTVPKDFDPGRIRLTGNVAGQPPYRGTLKHHGWVARQVRLPTLSETIDPRIIAPAEVELA